VLVDVGCGPGFVAVELAKRIGGRGHVHAMDINSDFVQHARRLVKEHSLTESVTVHLVQGDELPLPTGSVDRVLAVNVMVYVEDPALMYTEFRRILKPGGIAHAVDSDWTLTLAEPVPPELWSELMRAVAPGFRTPNIGRRLYGYARAAGFSTVDVQVASYPDTSGRLLPMVRGLCSRARRSKAIAPERIAQVERILDEALNRGTLLILNPQFVVTARV
jgi:SAM-dependent methyltransferase